MKKIIANIMIIGLTVASGIGIYAEERIPQEVSTFMQNEAENGGAIYWNNDGPDTFNTTFTDNEAGNGGAIYWNNDGPDTFNTTFTDNTAENGGAI